MLVVMAEIYLSSIFIQRTSAKSAINYNKSTSHSGVGVEGYMSKTKCRVWNLKMHLFLLLRQVCFWQLYEVLDYL